MPEPTSAPSRIKSDEASDEQVVQMLMKLVDEDSLTISNFMRKQYALAVQETAFRLGVIERKEDANGSDDGTESSEPDVEVSG